MATVIVKATESCNSRCSYCDVVRKANTGRSMSLEVLDALFARIDEYLRRYPEEDVEFLWHGGEPLLLGVDYYRAALELQRKRCPQTATRLKHAIQTNLTCFDERFVDVLQQLGINGVGTSYDAEPQMRGGGPLVDSETYNRSFLRALSCIERHGFAWGMIYVVTKRSLARPLDVFHLLTNLLLGDGATGGGGVNLNPVLIYDEERRHLAVSPEEMVEFYGAIFPEWWRHRARYPDVQPFRSAVECVVEGRIRLACVESGACARHHINVAPDGTTSQCGRAADWGLLPYGNIAERSLEAILGDEQRRQLEDRVGLLQVGECAGCRFWEVCHGGCPLDAWSQHKSFMHKSEWCEARRGFLERHVEPVTGARFDPARRS